MVKKLLVSLAGLFVVVVALAFVFDVPRFVIGLIQYGGQAREGTLQVGDPATDVTLYDIDGATSFQLSDRIGERPLVLIFGSFT